MDLLQQLCERRFPEKSENIASLLKSVCKQLNDAQLDRAEINQLLDIIRTLTQ